jgi:hypothetical protein
MATVSKKALPIGVFLALSFIVILILIFSPIFGEGRNGLQFSDDMFNKLAKGSSYFIPKMVKKNEGFMGKTFSVILKMEKEKEATDAVKVLTKAGAQVEATGNELKVSGDLGSLMAKALNDSDAMFKNDGKAVSELYGMNEKDVMKAWWAVMKGMDKAFKKEGKIEEANHVTEVSKKAVETAYNFYKIEAQKVSDKAVLMTGLLVFYVVYTLWWGFAIFFIFDGIGLSMKKAKVKKEV